MNIDIDFSKFKISLDILYVITFSNFNLINVSNINSNIRSLIFKDVYWNKINSNYFSGLNSLQKLTITLNNITTIENKTFIHIIILSNLNLINNCITHIESGAFMGLKWLSRLSLNNNYIFELNTAIFTIYNKIGIHENSYIKIQSNQLITIQTGLFVSHPVKQIDLSYNSITSIERNAFNATYLEILILNDNLISNIDEHVFGNLKQLKMLTISNNIIVCNCEKLKWIFKHSILKLLKKSINNYIQCTNGNTNLFEYNKINTCTNNKGNIYIYIYIYIYYNVS